MTPAIGMQVRYGDYIATIEMIAFSVATQRQICRIALTPRIRLTVPASDLIPHEEPSWSNASPAR